MNKLFDIGAYVRAYYILVELILYFIFIQFSSISYTRYCINALVEFVYKTCTYVYLSLHMYMYVFSILNLSTHGFVCRPPMDIGQRPHHAAVNKVIRRVLKTAGVPSHLECVATMGNASGHRNEQLISLPIG